ncbi:glycosyltransferase family 4 protein [Zunongwangia sp. F363]|uniref:Glycosyltransferase family 4 protein n=1 Tax=Autumnicola tepida TaxID=3075595 RepID=A0ABU3C9L1_9FLAO|nr:glycosyltransferase family 4 protein [Zunongwangia sp. F363]MDT0643024.1 glycosyltransferase family 4 protein [Zunongwangia sp. F363]
MGKGENGVEPGAELKSPVKRIIYIGNKLEKQGASPTTIDVLSPLFRKEGFQITAASTKRNKISRLLDMLLTISRAGKRAGFVLIDTYSTQNFWYAVLSGKMCRLLGIKYIPILHGGNLPHRLQKNKKVSRNFFENAFINIAPSRYLLEKFSQSGFKNVKYIPNPVELGNYRFKLRKKLQPKILWVRSFAEIYNPLMAVKTLELLLSEFPDASLCMVGSSKDDTFESCRDYAEEKNLPVVFTGKLEKQEWIALAAEFSIFLNTSAIDNTPVSVIEAMALGLPVISTNVGGMPYLVQDGREGILVNKNAEAAAAAVKFLLGNPGKAEKMSAAARNKVEKFDWEIVKQDWLQVLS